MSSSGREIESLTTPDEVEEVCFDRPLVQAKQSGGVSPAGKTDEDGTTTRHRFDR